MVGNHTPRTAEDFIKANLALTAHPDDPDIKLHLARPHSALFRLASEAGGAAPYWAFHWAGGGALLRYIVCNPDLVRGRSVLDFGAGSGVVGIAALRAGASAVLFVEPDPLARMAIALNCAANSMEPAGIAAEVTQAGLDSVDLVLAGDVFYDEEVAAASLALFELALERGINLLVGDPFRKHLPLEKLTEKARYEDLHDFGQSAPAIGCVFQLHACATAG